MSRSIGTCSGCCEGKSLSGTQRARSPANPQVMAVFYPMPGVGNAWRTRSIGLRRRPSNGSQKQACESCCTEDFRTALCLGLPIGIRTMQRESPADSKGGQHGSGTAPVHRSGRHFNSPAAIWVKRNTTIVVPIPRRQHGQGSGRNPRGYLKVMLSAGKPQTPNPRARAIRSIAAYSNGASGDARASPRIRRNAPKSSPIERNVRRT